MKVEYIQPFIQAIDSVFSALSTNKTNIGKIELRQTAFIMQDTSVIIGFVGDIKGQAFFTMDELFAKNIASVLLGGMEVTELDELVKSAVGELGNMIMGNACTLFYEKGLSVDITPPTILNGEKVRVSNSVPTFYFPVQIENIGELGFDVTIIDK